MPVNAGRPRCVVARALNGLFSGCLLRGPALLLPPFSAHARDAMLGNDGRPCQVVLHRL